MNSHLSNHINNVIILFLLQFINCIWSQDQQQQTISESTYVYLGCYTERADLFGESIYAKIPQTCIEICGLKGYDYAVLFTERCFCSNTINNEDRQDDRLCNKRCLANKSQYCGGVGVHSYYSSKIPKEPGLSNLKIINATENSLTITWHAFEPHIMSALGAEAMQQNQITHFLIKSQIVQHFSSLPLFAQPEFIVQRAQTQFEITDLHPATVYNITIAAVCGELICANKTIQGSTEVGVPSPVPQSPEIIDRNGNTITIEIPALKNDNGPVSKVLVIVEQVDDALTQPFDADLLGNWRRAQEDGTPYYITAELEYFGDESKQKRVFKIGDGKQYGPYTNVPIEINSDKDNGAHIHISLGVVSTWNNVTKILYTHSGHDQHIKMFDEFTYATFEKGRESIIALAVICTLFGTCLILAIATYIYLRYKTGLNANGSSNTHELTLQQSIIQSDNDAFVVDESQANQAPFQEQLNALLNDMDTSKRIPRNAIRLNVNDVLAKGQYGEVITGVVKTNAQTNTNVDCQLHIISLDDLSNSDQVELLRELSNLKKVQKHEHILEFFGVSASTDLFYIIFAYDRISLKQRLVDSRTSNIGMPIQRMSTIAEEVTLQWAYELASAMNYLSSLKVILKQLCSYTVYINNEDSIKLSVFGPIHHTKNQITIDITRWLSPESMRYKHYSLKSNVWTFACIAWECFTLGGTLYSHINDSQELFDAVKNGLRPTQPAFLYGDLYQLLFNCWQLEPNDRISFEDITFNIRQLMTAPKHALCFDAMQNGAVGNKNNVLLPLYQLNLEVKN